MRALDEPADIAAKPEFIPLSEPHLSGNEAAYVQDCVETGWVSSVGAYVDRFEEAISRVCGAEFGVAACTGTAALHLALLAAGVQAGDEVLVSDLTFIAPVNAIRYVGAHPILVDAEPRYWQMDFDRVEAFLRDGCERDARGLVNLKSGRVVRALLPVHILGHVVDLDRAQSLAERYGLVLIEDASESLGARHRGRAVGAIGDVGCFSFNGNKLLTTGGGGMLVTDDASIAKRARYLSTQAKDDPIEYAHMEIGFNYRLTNLQAAVGVAQVETLDAFLERKRAIAARYDEALRDVDGVTVPSTPEEVESAWWLYTILIDAERFGMGSRDLLARLQSESIQTRPLWRPIHLNPPYAEAMRLGGEMAEGLCRRALSVPCSVGLTEAAQERVIERILAAAH